MSRWLLAAVAVAALVPVSLAQEGQEMPAWMKLTKEHEALKKNVGTWKAAMEWHMNGQVRKSEGIARSKLIFGGRFLKQTFDGEAMGRPFNGMLLLGYDTIDKQYVTVWLDSMAPTMSIARGTVKDGAVRMESMEPDWMNPAGAKRKEVTVIKWIDDNTYTLEAFNVGDDGQETLHAKITYTRAETQLPANFRQDWQKPTEHHKALDKLVGTWDAQTDFRGLKEKGVAKFRKGGQVVTQNYRGTMFGIPFEGKHILSWDNIDKQYVAVWTDTMSPLILVSHGKAAEDGTIVFKGSGPSMSKPGTKEPMIMKYKWIDDDTFEMLFFGVVDGKEVPNGKIVYKRRKG